MMIDRERFIAIDANAIVHRAFHAYPDTLSTSDGLQVNAVFGFTSMLLKVLDEFSPKYIFCAFDTKKPTFRHTQFADYKAHRKPTDRSLVAQIPLVEEVLAAFNIPVIKKEGFEADDILGTVADRVAKGVWADYPLDLLIVTGDKDLLQLIGERVSVVLPEGSFRNLSIFDRAAVYKKFSYFPEQVVDFKAIVGDASDNIPGVKGIGQKTAIELLAKYKNLDGIYSHLKEITPRWQVLLGEGVEQAEMSKALATIDTSVDITLKLESCLMKDFNRSEVVSMFERFQFRSLINKIPSSADGRGLDIDDGQLSIFAKKDSSNQAGPKGQFNSAKVALVSGEDLQSKFFKKSFKGGRLFVAFIDGTESEDEAFYILAIVDNSGEVIASIVDHETAQAILLSFTDRAERETIFYNWEGAVSSGLVLDPEKVAFDLRLGAFLLSSGEKGYMLADLIYRYLGITLPKKISRMSIGLYVSGFVGTYNVLSEQFARFAPSEYTRRTINRLRKNRVFKVENGLLDILKKIDIPISILLAGMESRGVALDRIGLEDSVGKLRLEVESIKKHVYNSIGHEFNLNSPKQLAEVLYDELMLLPSKRKSSRTTREDVLKTLVGVHPCVELILKYREVSKILNTYLTPFLKLAQNVVTDGEGPRINSNFEQMGASSGRFSSKDPNLQNLPIKGDLANEVRKNIVARKGFKFIAMDYSQIELRVMADISRDLVLTKDFRNGLDIHTGTAARLFDMKPENVTSKERRLGKIVNFAILYGQTRYGLSTLLGVSSVEAESYINKYFESYKGVREYVSLATVNAQEHGYVESMLGRRRYISGLTSENLRVREASIREAINMPVQGSAAEIMKLAMLMICRLIDNKYKNKAFLVLQIHDELIFEVTEKYIEPFKSEALDLMENVIKLDVPLKVNWAVGDNLAQLKD